MNKPWVFVNVFESKTFEQCSKATNDSVPVQTQIPVSSSQIILPTTTPLPIEKPMIEIVVPVEEPNKQKRKKRRKK